MKKFSNFSEKDQRALILLGVFFTALLLYWALILSFEYQRKNMASWRENKLLQVSLISHGKKIGQLEAKKQARPKEGAEQTLLTVVSASAKEKQLSFKRFQPEGDTHLQLWLEDVSFDVLLTWLAQIESKNSIQIEQIAVERTKREGFVTARITLFR